MSLSFDGVDDVVTSGATQTLGTTVTLGGWFNAVSQGEGDDGVIFQHGADGAGNIRMHLKWNGTAASKKLQFQAGRATTQGTWEMTTGFAAVTGWKFVLVTYDTALTTNDPTFYTLVDSTFSILTIGSGVTETSTPVGAIIADNLTLRIGNNVAAGRTWNGLLGELATWTSILTAAEAAAVAFLGVQTIPGAFNYLPFDPTAQNLGSSATTFTITGAVAGENPPTRPAGRKG